MIVQGNNNSLPFNLLNTTTMTTTEYIRRKNLLLNTTAIRKNGVTTILHEGKEYPLKQWTEMHFLPDRLEQSKENPDCRLKFLIP